MRVKINVTKRHINKGVACSPSSCPVALAIKPKLKSRFIPRVYGSFICIENIDGITPGKDLTSPKCVERFIGDFDCGKGYITSLSFTLNIPKDFVRSIALKK